jgi:hypothetical protein
LRAARLAVGIACVAAAATLFVVEVPKTVRSLDRAVASYGPQHDAIGRNVTRGDILGISRDLQLQALAEIPSGSTYALLVPADRGIAGRVYGISEITYDTIGPWLTYLLLPSVRVAPDEAQYLICWGCDTSPWDHRTTWLFTNDGGVAIGRIRR